VEKRVKTAERTQEVRKNLQTPDRAGMQNCAPGLAGLFLPGTLL
jgi:hypothetical protein